MQDFLQFVKGGAVGWAVVMHVAVQNLVQGEDLRGGEVSHGSLQWLAGSRIRGRQVRWFRRSREGSLW